MTSPSPVRTLNGGQKCPLKLWGASLSGTCGPGEGRGSEPQFSHLEMVSVKILTGRGSHRQGTHSRGTMYREQGAHVGICLAQGGGPRGIDPLGPRWLPSPHLDPIISWVGCSPVRGLGSALQDLPGVAMETGGQWRDVGNGVEALAAPQSVTLAVTLSPASDSLRPL